MRGSDTSEGRDLQCAACGERLDEFHTHGVCPKNRGILLPRYDVLLCESDEFATATTNSELERPESSENPIARSRKPLPKSHTLGGIIQPY